MWFLHTGPWTGLPRESIGRNFPQAEVRIAFTSDFIRRKLLDRDNVTIDNPLTGNESESWKSMLEKEGFEIDYNLLGMGENDGIVEIFVGRTKEAFAKFK
ncbi:sirohydrochlorin cobaltochelatase [Methanothrix sp.]|uniref:sirohydrochlorin cobaltochelatase n=1 Tax=Methanothrix sp. TaxID=90426 RepID=UPI00329800D1